MSMNAGGYLRGPWWRYMGENEEKTRRCYVVAWGHIVNQPKEYFKNVRSIRFAIKCGRGAGRTEKHLLCSCYGDTECATVMRAMEKGDIVLVFGTWVESLKSKTKKGIKTTYEMQVKYIIPSELIFKGMILLSMPQIDKMIDDFNNETPDKWESD